MASTSSNPDGAAPLMSLPGDTIDCGNCGWRNQDDASFCRACGQGLGEAGSGYISNPSDLIQDPSCGLFVSIDSVYCDGCGAAIPSSAFAGYLVGALPTGAPSMALQTGTAVAPTSSSGRRPVVADTSPAARAAFLGRLRTAHMSAPPVQRGTFLERLSEAERAVELTEADLEETAGDLRVARAQAPEMAHSRSLSPHDRSLLLAFQTAEADHAGAVRAHEQARRTLNLMLAQYDAISRPDLGLPPGPESPDAWMWPGR
jgi:Double zinc ribbon